MRRLKSLGSEVIWYDSVAWNGNVCYQNCLTEANKPFLDLGLDGLFTNYKWNRDLLKRSQSEAKDTVTSSRVFIGVDCFGRGCPGGGGLSTNIALKLILDAMLERPDRPLSVALFAPGWPFENCDLSPANGNQLDAHQLVADLDEKFWSPLVPLLSRIRGVSQGFRALFRPIIPYLPACAPSDNSHPSVDLILSTDCCTGQGSIGTRGAFGSNMSRQHVTQFACPHLKNGAGTCLLIRSLAFSSRNFLIELFSFGPGTWIARSTLVTISIGSKQYEDAKLLSWVNAQSYQLVPFTLFIDWANCRSDPERIDLHRFSKRQKFTCSKAWVFSQHPSLCFVASTHTSPSCEDITSKAPTFRGLAATRLRIPVPEKPTPLRRGEGVGGGPEGRMSQLRKTVTALFDEERIELPWVEAVEARLYAERLLQEAILSCNEQDNNMLLTLWMQSTTDQELCFDEKEAQLSPAILELALFWLQKPRLIEKLFKVFVPRYRLYRRAYTSLHRLPRTHYPSAHAFHAEGFAVLELHGNPWPAVRAVNRGPDSEPYRHNYLINVLVAAARKSVLPAGTQSSTSPPEDITKGQTGS
ncbi:hypothetical protein EG68_02144 [Paragonimus skrjabini miyazakii]|uniref:Large ribosomal subunit protein bL17m n=1 Tax=Paragonimus skrjabini miyazakii TaxID=59628 RepID=A0A8S9YXQ6_9TREM|nr:hypothetical protein EG68_02144 [Paragonimus skrjabini miyazakii]